MNEAYYEDDTIMAKLGRSIIDQYIGWCQRYGEPKDLKGWASYVKGLIEGYMPDEEEEDTTPSWVDRHGVTCIECDNLTDEREAAYSDDNGHLCPVCTKDLHKEYADIIAFLDEGMIDEDIAQNLSNTRHLLEQVKEQLDNVGMHDAITRILEL